ncbi:MAG: DNA-processing protein DprA [Candidatus Omnitrophica bacterium]|nr:DNA-processing protein DprA [Candidatus Omnitrophota bacterium]
MREKDYYIALNMVSGLGSILISRLMHTFKTVQNIFQVDIEECCKVPGMSIEIAKRIKQILLASEFVKELEQIQKNNIEIITIAESRYPVLLKEIYDPPIVLYVKGDITVLQSKMLGVIGCRRASTYGLNQSAQISQALANRKICIVSGMARGIDTAAHKGALHAKGKTIAVLGSGFNNIYPSENKTLFDEISKNGAVISEFSLNTLPLRGNFPRRNRIISGLCRAIVVVEAAQKSGSLITADLALNQGREVLAVPGIANSLNAQGTNKLIKEGAKLVENAQDIMDALEVIWNF